MALPTAQSTRRLGAVAVRRVLVGGLVVMGVVSAWAGTSAAHASVVSSFPAQGAHLHSAPGTVSVLFDQPVKPDNGGLVVLNSTGAQVSTGSSHPAPDTLQARLPASLGAGPYVANYTVTSVDGHVVSGGVVFLVGNAKPGQIGQLTRRTSSFTGVVDKFGQFLIYLGVLASTGIAFFLAFILGTGPERDRLRKWCIAAATAGVLGMVVTAGSQTTLTGGAWGAVGHWAVLRQALGGKFGAQCIVQVAALAACLWSARRAPSLSSQLAAFYGLLVGAGAFVLFGHATVSPERWLSTPADVVHAVAAAFWIGGLVGLVVVLRARTRSARLAGELDMRVPSPQRAASEISRAGPSPKTSPGGTATALLERRAPAPGGVAEHVGGGDKTHGEDGDRHGNGTDHGDGMAGDAVGDANGARSSNLLWSTAGVVDRFSTMAGLSICALLVAGVLLSIAEVGSIWNLFDTGYGQILLVKIALVGLVLFVAVYNRFLLLPFLRHASSRLEPGGAGSCRPYASRPSGSLQSSPSRPFWRTARRAMAPRPRYGRWPSTRRSPSTVVISRCASRPTRRSSTTLSSSSPTQAGRR